MNPTGDSARRRSLLAKNIFMSLNLLQIVSNSGWGFACFSLKAAPVDFFFASFLLCPGTKEKSILSLTSMKKAVPDFHGTAELIKPSLKKADPGKLVQQQELQWPLVQRSFLLQLQKTRECPGCNQQLSLLLQQPT